MGVQTNKGPVGVEVIGTKFVNKMTGPVFYLFQDEEKEFQLQVRNSIPLKI